MNLKERAERFDQVASDFENFITKHKLEETIVDMYESCDMRYKHENLCNTPACHGGWLAIMYGVIETTVIKWGHCFYQKGADILADKLGFDNQSDLECWADNYRDSWGNDYGLDMFSCPRAFGFFCKLTI